jgi:hypothetical protein
MPPSGMPPSGIPPSGAPAVVSDSPRIASSGMSLIAAEAAPGSELSGPVIEIVADMAPVAEISRSAQLLGSKGLASG